jgi:RimJ/RimL family protein N-acetyltransferase
MSEHTSDPLADKIQLRDATIHDLPIFFEQQRDPDANYMAAFTAKDPENRDAYMARWGKILSDETGIVKAILLDGQVVGQFLSYVDEEIGHPEVGYWIGKSYWGKGIATSALAAFLKDIKERPLYARAAKDNVASLRVLEKCGFVRIGEGRGFANARGKEIEEFILMLNLTSPIEANFQSNSETIR